MQMMQAGVEIGKSGWQAEKMRSICRIAFVALALCLGATNKALSQQGGSAKLLPTNHGILGKWEYNDGQGNNYGGCSDPDGQGFFVIFADRSMHYDLVCEFERVIVSASAATIVQRCREAGERKGQRSKVDYIVINQNKIGESRDNRYAEYKRCKE